jgi:signal transduction histidine kinase
VAAFFTRRNQLQWLGLLGLAVVLPTVSLLWFMSRVIANERLVVRQKLSALYQDKLTEASGKTGTLFTNRLATLDKLKPEANPYAAFRRLVLENNFQGLVIWNADGAVVYPRTGELLGNDVSTGSPLASAWHEEFAKRDFTVAVQLYDRFTNDNDPQVAIGAVAGKSRCLGKLGRLDEAIAECQMAAFATAPKNAPPTLRRTIENARLLLLSLLKQSAQPQQHREIFQRTVTALMNDLYNPDGNQTALPANQNLFIAQKVLEALRGPLPFPDQAAKTQLEKLVAAEELSMAAAETLRPFTGQFDGLFQTDLGGKSCYGLRHRTESATLLVVLSDAGIASVLSGYHDTFNGTAAAYRILDASGDFVAGAKEPQSKAFAAVALPDGFPGWKVELYFEGSDVFEKAARRQIAVYTWTGFLVILLILIVGGFATRAVGRQIRLNEMKNDFIATVSHELKTPLASMRVLVDTLLEGRVKDEAQVQHYLQLTAKENERLSRMIDNFLTFSRMERNKVAFTIVDAKPAVIASDANEAVKTKYDTHDCQLTLEIPKDLPDVQADHDAIVTVLVNLLDNACKYTTEHKQVSLRLYPEGRDVCFAVSDNGIGLARRHLRKIFDRFYQVDSSLSRKAEGCGLGLSIVKFIVDAHQGKISVESKPGSGSTFTVRLPVAHKNGD